MAKRPTKPAKKVAKKPVAAKPAAKTPVKAAPRPKAVAAPVKPLRAPDRPKPIAIPTRAVAAAPPPPPPIAVVRAPSAEAVQAFERGMGALHRHDYKTASTTFQALLAEFPNEGFLGDRARVYLELAMREMKRQPSGSGNIEERLTSATHALNNHNDIEAARLAADVLKEDASQDLAEYLLAVVASRGGDVETALAHLRNAIDINPECRLQARQDEEFDPLMDSDDFHALIEAPPTSTSAPQTGLPIKKPIRKPGR